MSADENCAGCRDLEARIARLEAAPQLAQYMKNAQIIDKTRATFALIAELRGMDADHRAVAIRSRDAGAIKQALELANFTERVEITDGLDDASRILAMRWLDRNVQIAIAVAQIDPDLVPELVTLENKRDYGIEWRGFDDKGKFALGRQMQPRDIAVQLRSDFEREANAIEEVGEHIQRGFLVVRDANAHEINQWLTAAVASGERLTLSRAFRVESVERGREVHTSESLEKSTRRSVERVRDADLANRRAAAPANKAAAENANRSRASKHHST